jgi:chaperone required for assembly of F1-ATPase
MSSEDKPAEYARGVKGEIDQRPKRFYKDVSVAADGPDWRVLLDNRGLRTPNGAPLLLPAEKLAEAIAAEWRAQEERIDLHSMILTRLAYGAIDRTDEMWEAVADEAARYAGTDLVCYLADRPVALRERQDSGWGPLRAWAAEAHGVALEAVSGIIPKEQDAVSLEAMRRHVAMLDTFRKAGMAHAVPLLGSAVLALAVERGLLSAAEAYELSRIDEAFQNEQWGEDAEAARRTALGRREAAAMDVWFAALA